MVNLIFIIKVKRWEKGERVRSKSEKIIADKLYMLGIPYRYEYPLVLDGNYKLNTYEKNAIYLGVQLFVTYETSRKALNVRALDDMIKKVFCAY